LTYPALLIYVGRCCSLFTHTHVYTLLLIPGSYVWLRWLFTPAVVTFPHCIYVTFPVYILGCCYHALHGRLHGCCGSVVATLRLRGLPHVYVTLRYGWFDVYGYVPGSPFCYGWRLVVTPLRLFPVDLLLRLVDLLPRLLPAFGCCPVWLVTLVARLLPGCCSSHTRSGLLRLLHVTGLLFLRVVVPVALHTVGCYTRFTHVYFAPRLR